MASASFQKLISCNNKKRHVTSIGAESITPAIICVVECKEYKHEYFPHYYRDCIQKTKYIPSKLSYNSKLFYFGGQRAFKRKIFIIFTSNFVTCHLTYNSYCDAHRATIKDSYPSTNPILDPKIFQHNHFIFELCRFVFMLTTSEFSEIQLDYLSDEHDRYFREKNSTLYSLFANRTVCNYDNVIDLSIPELGPILIGCYETPVRRNSGIHHDNTVCSGCGQSPVYGIRWRCGDCPNVDLCSMCYHGDRHNIRHRFCRILASNGE
ncbi:unnamed protein product, partial [Didymodactylos carnosus]